MITSGRAAPSSASTSPSSRKRRRRTGFCTGRWFRNGGCPSSAELPDCPHARHARLAYRVSPSWRFDVRVRFRAGLNEQIGHEFGACPAVHRHRRPLRRRDAAAAGRALLPAGVGGAKPRHDDRAVPARRRAGGGHPGGGGAPHGVRGHGRAGRPGARAGAPGDRPDQRARRHSPATRATTRRAVHAVVHQGAGRGGFEHVRPAQGGRAARENPLLAEEYLVARVDRRGGRSDGARTPPAAPFSRCTLVTVPGTVTAAVAPWAGSFPPAQRGLTGTLHRERAAIATDS